MWWGIGTRCQFALGRVRWCRRLLAVHAGDCALFESPWAVGLSAFLAALLLPMFASDDTPARRGAWCQNNLKIIHMALAMYAQDHEGRFPDALSRLFPEYEFDLRVFVCPGTKEEPGAPGDLDAWTGYTYSKPETGRSEPTTIVCQCKFPCHPRSRRNTLRVDGRVHSVEPPPGTKT